MVIDIFGLDELGIDILGYHRFCDFGIGLAQMPGDKRMKKRSVRFRSISFSQESLINVTVGVNYI